MLIVEQLPMNIKLIVMRSLLILISALFIIFDGWSQVATKMQKGPLYTLYTDGSYGKPIIYDRPVAFNRYIEIAWDGWNWSSSDDIYGNYGDFYFYPRGGFPRDYYFRVTLKNFSMPTQKELKRHRKKEPNKWYEYQATVEYIIDDKYPTLKDAIKALGMPLSISDHNYQSKNKPFVKRSATATVRISPNSSKSKVWPEVYNIWIDNIEIGIAIDLRGGCWSNHLK